MTRTSLVEQYNNRDVIAQIYRLISLVESSTITSVETLRTGDTVTLILNMYDGTEQRFQFETDGIRNITAVQNGSYETVNILMDSGRAYSFSFEIAIAGVTTDTPQDITATKTFTRPQVFEGGITGPLQIDGTTVIDGEVQVSNGHSMSVAGDVNVAEDLQVVGNTELMGNTEIGGMAVEKSGNKTIMSNINGITMVGQVTEEVPTTPTGSRGLGPANGQRVQNDLDAYLPMIRTTDAQTKNGVLTLNDGFIGFPAVWHRTEVTGMPVGQYSVFAEIPSSMFSNGKFCRIGFVQSANSVTCYGEIMFRLDKVSNPIWLLRKTSGGPFNPLTATSIVLLMDDADNPTFIKMAWKKTELYGSLRASEIFNVNYGRMIRIPDSPIIWYDDDNVVLENLDGYIVTEVTE